MKLVWLYTKAEGERPIHGNLLKLMKPQANHAKKKGHKCII